MRLVATSDTHKKVDISLIPDGDVFVHAGDLCETGYPDDWKQQLEWLAEIPHQHKYIIFGNHDFHAEVYPGPALQDMRKIGFKVLGYPGNKNFYTTILPNKMLMGGISYIGGLNNRWAFGDATLNRYNETLQNMICECHKCDIMVTHEPVYGILDYSQRGNVHCGNTTIRNFIDMNYFRNLKYFIHGHIHEQYGHELYNDINFHNVAMCDRKGNHKNPPLVLDL